MREADKIQLNRNFKTHSNKDGKVKLLLSNASYCFVEESTKFIDSAH